MKSVKEIPLHCLVIIIGGANSGKTTYAYENFNSYEIINYDNILNDICGANVRHDIAREIHEEVRHRVRTKIVVGERAVVDAPNLKKWERNKLAQIGVEFGVPVFYIIVERSLEDKLNAGQNVNKWLIEKQHELFLMIENDIKKGEGVAETIDSREDDIKVINKLPLGDIFAHIQSQGFSGITVIPDIHSTYSSLKQAVKWAQSLNRFIIFLGDIVDYGPKPIDCVNLCYELVVRGEAIAAVGNHELKILRWLTEKEKSNIKMKINEGTKITTDIIDNLDYQTYKQWSLKFKTLIALSRHHIRVKNIVLAHAAVSKEMWENDLPILHGKDKSIAIYGQLGANKSFENNKPNRVYDWINDIEDGNIVIVGHEIRQTHKPYEEINSNGGKVVFMDTGSGKGGKLSTADVVFVDGNLSIQNYNQF